MSAVANVALEHAKSELSAVAAQAYAVCEQVIAVSGGAAPDISAVEVMCGIESAEPAPSAPTTITTTSTAGAFSPASFAPALYGRVMGTVSDTSVDMAVKSRALSCLGLLTDRLRFVPPQEVCCICVVFT